ncbi:uncharacterized protein LOC133199980 [Saccostrea echinata]|uniref:uncharacterized protein LOC133199980 n=1 Tax=Saccostrea echinata TaxID=191078 RepID=UPI002A80974D|nr:uncharacterized protein LOC133199980 [Saccostrea echinata]
MASHNSPGTQVRRRQLPSLSVETANRQKSPLTSHMTYKSSLEYLMKNEGTFAKVLELIRRYPTLADHRSTGKIWEILSLGTKSVPRRPLSSYDTQRCEPLTMPTISVSSEVSSDLQCPSCARHEKLHLGIIGMSSDHSDTLKWSPLVCRLSSEVFVNCFKSSMDMSLEIESVDGIVFFMTSSSFRNVSYLQALSYAQEQGIPVVFVREPGLKLPHHVSGEFTEKILLQQGIKQQSPTHSYDDLSTNDLLRSDALPPISKSGYYFNSEQKKVSSLSRPISPELLVNGFKEALLHSGNNTDYCVQVTIKIISQSPRTRKQRASANMDDSKLKPPTFDNFLETSTTSTKRQNFAKGGLFTDNVSESSSSTESSEDSVVEVSPAKQPIDRRESLDQETIYVLFPDRNEGASTAKPVYVKWPPSKNEVYNSDTTLTDVDDESFLSDSSVGFQDVDLADIMSTSDEESIVT